MLKSSNFVVLTFAVHLISSKCGGIFGTFASAVTVLEEFKKVLKVIKLDVLADSYDLFFTNLRITLCVVMYLAMHIVTQLIVIISSVLPAITTTNEVNFNCEKVSYFLI